MKQFFTVLKFELSQKFKEKSFLISMLITGVIFFGIAFIPGLLNKGSSNSTDKAVDSNEELTKVVLYLEDGVDKSVEKTISENYSVTKVNSIDELKSKVEKKEAEQGIHILNDITAVVYEQQSSLYPSYSPLQKLLADNYKYNIALKNTNYDINLLKKIENIQVNVNTQSLGKNPVAGYFLSYFVVFFLYFLIILNGQSIATNVAKEKDNRTMELLVTNVNSNAMIWGKVISGLIASFASMFVMVICSVAGILLNLKSSNGAINKILELIISQLTLTSILTLLGYTLFGVMLYFLLYAAMGSLVSKLDEINQALTPITMIIVIAFMIPMFGMTNADSPMMKIASIVPFTSPFSMFTRTQMSVVPTSELLLSFGLLLITTILVAIIASKIYRNGTLNYGNRLNLWKAITRKTK